ncbi:MAG: hypothetical protein SVP26_10805 [Chloroflexota bacterium]|nr:hypothetical protein [Chloroflexota bacterium]
MEAHLSVVTCDKCGEPMDGERPVVVVAEGAIVDVDSHEVLTFQARSVRYACHLDCWDGVEDGG